MGCMSENIAAAGYDICLLTAHAVGEEARIAVMWVAKLDIYEQSAMNLLDILIP